MYPLPPAKHIKLEPGVVTPRCLFNQQLGRGKPAGVATAFDPVTARFQFDASDVEDSAEDDGGATRQAGDAALHADGGRARLGAASQAFAAPVASTQVAKGYVKAKHNMLSNNLRSVKCPVPLRDEWGNTLKKLPVGDPKRVEFYDAMAAVKEKLYVDQPALSMRLQEIATLQQQKEANVKESWRSYKWVCDKEGEVVVNEALRLNALDTQTSSLLPANHQCPAPLCYEIWYSREEFVRRMTKATSNTVTIDRGEIDLDELEAIETLGAEMTAQPSLPRRIDTSSLKGESGLPVKREPGVGSQVHAFVAAPVVAGATPNKEDLAKTKKMKERCNECMKTASKVHGDWDRRKREFKVTHAISQKNRNTNGSPVAKPVVSVALRVREIGPQHHGANQ